MKKRIGVLLAGAGVFDGSEIHEATLTLLYIDMHGAEAVCLAPDKTLSEVNHLTKKETGGIRKVTEEAARISRGSILPLSESGVSGLDALILPGGFGAVKNLCDYAVKGRDCSVDPQVQQAILSFIDSGKTVGAICIAPVVVAAAVKHRALHPELTIGSDRATAEDLAFFGAVHKPAKVDEIIVDTVNNIVSTPAYMLGPGISDVAKGIEKLVKYVIDV